jgi:hypothetical protein
MGMARRRRDVGLDRLPHASDLQNTGQNAQL